MWWVGGSLLALHSFPALEVYLGMLPVYVALYRGQEAILASDAVGFAICILATILEYTADTQLSNFRKKTTDHQVWFVNCDGKEKADIIGKVLACLKTLTRCLPETVFPFGLISFCSLRTTTIPPPHRPELPSSSPQGHN